MIIIIDAKTGTVMSEARIHSEKVLIWMDLMVLFQERVTFMVSCRISINPPPLTEDQQIILTSDYPTPKIGASKQPE